ncbi:LysE family translocator [Cellulosilyticum sp. I15G10I2]|uniref:LysE family translocator n=1 Tax=Cellulosilyticum sp. I15G10I2 TaxID=1892843 RepID=UPI001FA7252D|nr:LysE family transporter [Cellulosilyticum sp. I15G10I2]
MLLQLSIGPMCLMVFNTSGTYGILMGLVLVCAISLVDATYIALAGCGVAAVLKNTRIQQFIKIFGCLILTLFGFNIIINVFNYSILPSIQLFSNMSAKNIFFYGILLTASNPLTVIFWSGVFSAEAIDKKMDKYQLILFGIGCILATVIFLSGIALAGSVINTFLSQLLLDILNVIVGLVMIGFGLKLVLKKGV